jgi:hypothetical protein
MFDNTPDAQKTSPKGLFLATCACLFSLFCFLLGFLFFADENPWTAAIMFINGGLFGFGALRYLFSSDLREIRRYLGGALLRRRSPRENEKQLSEMIEQLSE